MTKIGILSDLHLEFDGRGVSFEFTPDPDIFYIIAGDLHPYAEVRKSFLNKFDPGMIMYIPGNHDYYGSNISNWSSERNLVSVGGLVIAGATLWTDLTDPQAWYWYKRSIADAHYIDNWTQEECVRRHEEDREFLFNSGADIIVSHHLPSRHSIAPRFEGEPSNVGFVTDYTDRILAMEKPPKIWIHGHTHDKFDYTLDSTRIICHPRGYPGENPWYSTYEPLILEF